MAASPDGAPAPLVTAAAVARQLGVSQSWVYLKAEAGVLPHRRLGGDDGPVRFVQAEIDEWFEEQRERRQPSQSWSASRPPGVSW
jgi:excisionase family DNA binding protein